MGSKGAGEERAAAGGSPGSGVVATATAGTAARNPLSRDAILEAALRLVEDHGLEALTMRRLGGSLGVEAMSLYYHLSGKRAILDGIVDLLMRRVEPPPEEGPWTEVAAALFQNIRSVLRRHPHAVPLFLTRSPYSPEALRPIEASLRNLRGAGFDDVEAIDAHRLLMSFTTGYVMSEVSLLDDPEADPNAWGTAAFGARDLDHERFPTLSRLGRVALARSADEQFGNCLAIALEGLRSRLDGNRPRRR